MTRLYIEPMHYTIIKIGRALCEQLDMPGHTLQILSGIKASCVLSGRLRANRLVDQSSFGTKAILHVSGFVHVLCSFCD